MGEDGQPAGKQLLMNAEATGDETFIEAAATSLESTSLLTSSNVFPGSITL